MTKNQLVVTDSAWNTRRVRAPLIWKVEKIEQIESDNTKSMTVIARPREVKADSSEDGNQTFALAA